jgi:integrase
LTKRALTAAAVNRIKPPQNGQCDHFDAGYPGLALRVSYGGARAWVYFYRVHGKQRRMTLGRYPAMTLADARAEWQNARRTVGIGEDPARRKTTADNSFGGVADEWLKRDQANNRSRGEVERILNRDVKPEWSGRPIEDIRRRDVLDLIDAIADRGAVTLARRVHAHIHRLFRWAVGRGIIDANPAADVPKPGAVVKRDRVLSDAEVATVWTAAGELGWPFCHVIRLLMLTGARRDEIGALTWAEVREDRIELAGQRTKNGEPHTIPLSSASCDIIESLPRISDSRFVFTTTGTTPISGWSRAKQLLDREAARLNHGTALPPWRLHDLRRTTATGLQRLGVALPVIEAVLGHISGSRAGVVGIYQRYSFDDEKRIALDAWARRLTAIRAPMEQPSMRLNAVSS